jgi:hypothetical protein
MIVLKDLLAKKVRGNRVEHWISRKRNLEHNPFVSIITTGSMATWTAPYAQMQQQMPQSIPYYTTGTLSTSSSSMSNALGTSTNIIGGY